MFPEKFNTHVEINKDGTYSLSYDGILTFVPARTEELKKGKLDDKIEQDLRDAAQELMKKDNNFQKMRYIGHGQFEVLYVKRGMFNTKDSIDFGDKKRGEKKEIVEIVALEPLEKNRVKISGMRLYYGENTKEFLQNIENVLKIKMDGSITILTDATVLEHNSTNAPHVVGLKHSYRWEIKSTDTRPYMLLQLQK